MGFVVVVLPAAILVIAAPGLARRRRFAKQAARFSLLASGSPIQVAGLDKLPQDQPCVVVANHASYLDGIVLQGALPPNFSFVIKREMEKVPFVNFLLMRLGSQYVDRSDRRKGGRDALRILRLAQSGQALGFFPEGTFDSRPGLKRFHLGAFTAAARHRMPLCPIRIEGTRDILPADAWLPRPGLIRVTVLDCLEPPDNHDQASIRDLRDRARQTLLQSHPEPDLLLDQPAAST